MYVTIIRSCNMNVNKYIQCPSSDIVNKIMTTIIQIYRTAGMFSLSYVNLFRP